MLAPLFRAPWRVSAMACLASLAGLAAIGTGHSLPDRLIERSYAQAFDQLDDAPSVGQSTGFDRAHVHLSRLPATVPVGPSLAVGDRITLAQRTGGTAVYEVVEVRPLPGVSLGASGASSPETGLPGMLMITASSTDQLPAKTMRFIVDAEVPTPAKPALNPRAL